MNILDAYSKKVINALNFNHVEYLIVGGYAVNYYGYKRTTGDIDIWIKPENTINKQFLIQALLELDIDEESIEYLKGLDFTKPVVFMDGDDPFKIDFMTHLAGKVSFEEAYKLKTIQFYDEVQLPFIHYKHLIESKITSNRLKDKLDIETLQKINQNK